MRDTPCGVSWLVASGLLFAACNAPSRVELDYFSPDFAKALNETCQRANGQAFEHPPTADWSQRQPVVLALGLDDCIELADKHRVDILLLQLSEALSEANVLAEYAATDISITGGLNVRRTEQDLATLLVGDARTTERETVQDLEAALRAPFFTGTEVALRHNLMRTTTNSPFNSFAWSSSVGLTVTQRLLDGFGFVGTRTGYDRAKLERAATARDAEAGRRDARYAVAQAYWNLVLAREDLGVLQRQRDTAQLSLERAQRRFDEGLATRLDVLRANSSLATQQRTIIAAELEVLRKSDELLRAVHPDLLYGYAQVRGYALRVEPEDRLRDVTPEPTLPDVNATALVALEKRADLRALLGRLEASGLSVRQREQALLPQLDATLGTSLVGRGSDFSDASSKLFSTRHNILEGGLTFSIPISNRADEAAFRSAVIQREELVIRAREKEVEIIVDVVDAIRHIDSGIRGIGSAVTARDLAREEYEATVSRLEAGLGTTYEVEQARATFTAAERDLVKARVELELARLRLLRATGA